MDLHKLGKEIQTLRKNKKLPINHSCTNYECMGPGMPTQGPEKGEGSQEAKKNQAHPHPLKPLGKPWGSVMG